MIITQTVGQMTEKMASNTIATQTPFPKTYLSFASLASKSKASSTYQSAPFERQMMENDLLLQVQQNALKTIDLKLTEKYLNEHQPKEERTSSKQHSGSLSDEQITPRDGQQDENSQSISSSAPDSSSQQIKIDKVAMKMVITSQQIEFLRFVLNQIIK